LKLILFDSSTFNNVAKVNHLGPSSNYHLFKQGIRPEWEDEANAEGGKFGIQFPKNKAGDAINEYWMYLVCKSVNGIFAR
jgi:translation initiation factor 4E